MSSIPTWVYLLFLALMYIGISRCFTSTIKVKQLIILPIVLAWFSLSDLWHPLNLTYYSLWSYVIGVGVGFSIIFSLFRNRNIRADKTQNLIEIPGDWTYLLFLIVFFLVEFIISYYIAITSPQFYSSFVVTFILFILGTLTGMAFGRNGSYLYKFIHAKHSDLTLTKINLFK